MHVALGDAANWLGSQGVVQHGFDCLGDSDCVVGLHQGQDVLGVRLRLPLLVEDPGFLEQRAEGAVRAAAKTALLKGSLHPFDRRAHMLVGLYAVRPVQAMEANKRWRGFGGQVQSDR